MKFLAVLDHYGFLQGASVWNGSVKIVCPFHGDTRPSLKMESSGLYYCFGCGARGSTLTEFIGAVEHVDNWVALRRYVELTSGMKDEVFAVERRGDNREQTQEAFDFFYSLPKPSWRQIRNHYMMRRGFSARILRKFDVRINQSAAYPIIVPIFEETKFIGYVCRRIDEEDPKYLYNEGFSRNTVLAGHLRRGVTLVVEGMLDLMKATQFGFANTVAFLGWKASAYAMEMLEDRASLVICATDNDRAGIDGYRYLRQELKVPVVRFPYPHNRKDIGGSLDPRARMTKEEFDRALEMVG